MNQQPETPSRPRVLVVEDDPHISDALAMRLDGEGHDVARAASVQTAFEQLHQSEFDVILLDVSLGEGGNGLDVLREAKASSSLAEVILVTATDSVHVAAQALRLGAMDYLQKPVRFEDLKNAVQRAIEKVQLARQEMAIKRLVETSARFPEIVGESAPMKELTALVQKAASAHSPVLILGETGTGKELVARTIHLQSPRNKAPFVPINCAGVPEALIESELFGYEKGAFTGAEKLTRGLMEIAHGGTLFLDELEEMSPAMQAKLLRVLDSGEFRRVGGRPTLKTDVRIIAATNRAPAVLMKEGRLREDLFFRLCVVTVSVPPLRARKGDIGFLARYFTTVLSRETVRPRRISDEAIAALERYRWPGNVRELRNLIERLILVTEGEVIDAKDLPAEVASPSMESRDTAFLRLEEVERRHILRVLAAVGDNRREAARVLGISEMTLYRRLRQYGVESPQP